jgi:hypothetical protein
MLEVDNIASYELDPLVLFHITDHVTRHRVRKLAPVFEKVIEGKSATKT